MYVDWNAKKTKTKTKTKTKHLKEKKIIFYFYFLLSKTVKKQFLPKFCGFPCQGYLITINCIRYLDLPLVHKGAWNSTKKTIFPADFFFLHHIIYTNHNHIPAKKNNKIKTKQKQKQTNTKTKTKTKQTKNVPFQNGGQITDFHFASF